MTVAVAAVIVAAGRGTRAGSGLPKQWRMLNGMTVLERTISRFQNHPLISQIVLVLHADDLPLIDDMMLGNVLIATGGSTRDASVLAGLNKLEQFGITKVLIHDVARPLVSTKLITRVIDALANSNAAAPGLSITDALWTGSNGNVSGVQDRQSLFRAQTPQGFDYAMILAAHHDHHGGAADDVEVARTAGIEVQIVEGEERNLKITTVDDFQRAADILRNDMDIRVGNGFDVHRFGDGDHVILCGIRVPFGRGLQGHSDADVGMHALTDAIYGALAQGDIGQHFPPSDPRWKGADSHIFLEHAVSLCAEHRLRISNVDVTLICEQPKIGPLATEMAARLAGICKIETNRVSVKATTSERLGFTGREEGIAALATATLISK